MELILWHIKVHAHTHTHTHTHTHKHTLDLYPELTGTCTHTHTHKHTHTHTYTHIHTHELIHTYTHTHRHTHARTQAHPHTHIDDEDPNQWVFSQQNPPPIYSRSRIPSRTHKVFFLVVIFFLDEREFRWGNLNTSHKWQIFSFPFKRAIWLNAL